MAVQSYRTIGEYAPNEAATFFGPKKYTADGSIIGILRCHGSGGTDTSVLNARGAPSDYAMQRRIALRYPTLSAHLAGDAWGNDTALARVTDAKAYVQGRWGAKAGKVILHAGSMGAVTALNWARANLASVAAVIAEIPVVDVNDIVVNNRAGMAGQVNAAYGGAWSQATHGPTHNPATYAAELAGLPIQLWYSVDDTIALPGPVEAFQSAVGASCEIHPLTGEHGQVPKSQIDLDALMAFIDAHAA